jgi:tetratricopeptide (TPR) repeat protein
LTQTVRFRPKADIHGFAEHDLICLNGKEGQAEGAAMSDTPDFDADPIESAVEPSAAAIGLALGAAQGDPNIANDAREFLRKQSRYLDLQMEDLHEQRDLTLSHLRWRRFNDWIRAAWQSALAVLAVFAVLTLFVAMRNAHEARGLVVRSLKTPPDFAAKGLDGSVLAQRLLDKLNGLVAESEPIAFRSADGIRGDWGDESKVEIPETGVSVEELSRALRNWLGRETHVSGEIWPTATGIAVTVRADANTGVTVTGGSADLDKLLDRAAEKVLAQTQPYRYAGVLVQRGRYAQAVDFLRPIAHGANRADRAWAYTFWSNTLVFAGKNRESLPYADMAVRLDPTDPSAYFSRLSAEAILQQLESSLRDTRAMDRLLSGPNTGNLSVPAAAVMRQTVPMAYCSLAGDHVCAANAARPLSEQNFYGYDHADLLVASELALAHDGGAARSILASHPGWDDGTAIYFSGAVGSMMPYFFLLANVGQWSRAAADAEMADRAVTHSSQDLTDERHSYLWPWLAYALAKSGDVRGADVLISKTALDCTPCLEMRGRIASVAGRDAQAYYWFARTISNAPSAPFAMADWGEMLLHRGNFDDAIAKFTLANRIGPHFADPLEMWGEALIAKNRSDLALLKFVEANKYAPNWGRLHLKWGEALTWLGRNDEAKAQFRVASSLDVSDADRAVLARNMRR